MTMLEKMARAMLDSSQDVHPAQQPYTDYSDGMKDVVLDGCFDLDKMISAALMVIREPSTEMKEYGAFESDDCGQYNQPTTYQCGVAYTAMIDAILSETPTT